MVFVVVAVLDVHLKMVLALILVTGILSRHHARSGYMSLTYCLITGLCFSSVLGCQLYYLCELKKYTLQAKFIVCIPEVLTAKHCYQSSDNGTIINIIINIIITEKELH